MDDNLAYFVKPIWHWQYHWKTFEDLRLERDVRAHLFERYGLRDLESFHGHTRLFLDGMIAAGDVGVIEVFGRTYICPQYLNEFTPGGSDDSDWSIGIHDLEPLLCSPAIAEVDFETDLQLLEGRQL